MEPKAGARPKPVLPPPRRRPVTAGLLELLFRNAQLLAQSATAHPTIATFEALGGGWEDDHRDAGQVLAGR